LNSALALVVTFSVTTPPTFAYLAPTAPTTLCSGHLINYDPRGQPKYYSQRAFKRGMGDAKVIPHQLYTFLNSGPEHSQSIDDPV
jgi:hypothetical protein